MVCSFVRKHFSLEAANFSLFSQEGEVTSPLTSGPAWTLRLQFTKYQQRYAPMKFKKFFFFCNSTYSLYPELWILQEPVYVLHLITCHGRIMPCLAALLFRITGKLVVKYLSTCTKGTLNIKDQQRPYLMMLIPCFLLFFFCFFFLIFCIKAYVVGTH